MTGLRKLHLRSICHEMVAGNATAPSTPAASTVSIFRCGLEGRNDFLHVPLLAKVRYPQREIELRDLPVCWVLLRGCVLESWHTKKPSRAISENTSLSISLCPPNVLSWIPSLTRPLLDLFWVSPGLRNTPCYFLSRSFQTKDIFL